LAKGLKDVRKRKFGNPPFYPFILYSCRAFLSLLLKVIIRDIRVKDIRGVLIPYNYITHLYNKKTPKKLRGNLSVLKLFK